jgi:hypothetical protein
MMPGRPSGDREIERPIPELDDDWIPGVSMGALSEEKQAYIARLRASGLKITSATIDYLPPPEHTLPPKRGLFGYIAWRIISALRFRRSKHALVP